MTPVGSPDIISPTIAQWEDAGASLVVAFKNYMELCLNLGTNALREGANWEDLTSRIDATLAVIHTTVSYCLDESSSALARTRNKLASPLFRFPEEVMSEIFMNVVFDQKERESSRPAPLERGSRLIYRRLYKLLRVCTVWRDIALARGALWSVVPIIEGGYDKKHKVVKRILQRAGAGPLHLVASMAWSAPTRLIKVVDNYTSRLRTINISASGRYVIRDIIKRLLQNGTPGSLSELSIQFSEAGYASRRVPEEFDYIIPRDRPEYTLFPSLVEMLTAFRVSGAHFYWDTMAFSTRLVELHIDQITLGYDNAIDPFVQALSSAPNLRDLKIISVSTFHSSDATHDRKSSTPVSFPKLESLLLQDLYFNTLEYMLPTISPGSYHLTLYLTRRSIETNVLREVPGDEEEDEEPEFVDVRELGSVLVRTPVHTLMIRGIWSDCWLTGPGLRALLTSMPTLKTLKMHYWDLDRTIWRALRRSSDARSHPDDHLFPALENIHFYSARIHNQRGLKNMISSHPTQVMVLGAVLADTPGDSSDWDSCGEDDSIVAWLKTNIPVFRLVNRVYEPPEFHSASLDIKPCPTVAQWEEAGTSLVAALKNYMELCLNLGTNSLREGANLEDLVSQIDSTLAVIHTTASHCLGESGSALARTRNRLASPLFRFPEEVMSEIFMSVVFDRKDRKPDRALPLERGTRSVYRRLYKLLRVCTVWRDIVLARGSLWSVIPILEGGPDKKHKAVKRILRRAGGAPLHLVASMSWTLPDRLIKVLNDYTPNLRTINISASSRYVIKDIVNRLLQNGTSGPLSELSIQFSSASLVEPRVPEEYDYIVPRDHPEYTSFVGLVKMLTAFRVNGTHFHWDALAFSTRLVELRIERIELGYDSAIAPFVQALSSAPNLRDLKLISVSTFHNSDATYDWKSLTPVSFPKLESLLLQDLYFNTLRYLLLAISPGSYHLTLFLTCKSIKTKVLRDEAPGNEEEDEELRLVDAQELGFALVDTPVHTLMLSGVWDDCWLTGPELRLLLITMPALKTLKMATWDLDRTVWRALRRSSDARSHPEDHRFPALENIHFYSARIHNQRGLKNMVSSHPIQEMVLGSVLADTPGDSSDWDSCDEDDRIITWLKGEVPAFRLVGSVYEPPEFHSAVWQLW